MKMVLYCTKNKWRLFFDKVKQIFSLGKLKSNNDLNGKIVAECDYEVEEIGLHKLSTGVGYDYIYETETRPLIALELMSCLDLQDLENYLGTEKDNGEKVGYAIHIKNLHIFDESKKLSEYYMCNENGALIPITKAPQNMMYATQHLGEPMYVENHYIGLDDYFEDYVLISIRPEWLCKILNGEKTIEVRKKVLKEMLK